MNPSTIQFVLDALRTLNSPPLDLSKDENRRKMSRREELNYKGTGAIRNADGTSMSIAQIAFSSNLSFAQVTQLFGSI